MRLLVAVLVGVGLPLVGVIVSDLFADVPRCALWIVRRAERIVPIADRSFFGLADEVQIAAAEAAEGRRSRLSVLLMAIGALTAAVRQRVRRKSVLPPLGEFFPHDNWVKIALPWEQGAYWVWAESIGEHLYRIDNQPLFSDVCSADDLVRAEQVEGMRPGWLEFRSVLVPTERTDIFLWIRFRFLCKHRRRRLAKTLHALDAFQSWHHEIGKAALPPGDASEKLLRRLSRRLIYWERVDREAPPHEWSYRAWPGEVIRES
jgi:hypothetical protein